MKLRPCIVVPVPPPKLEVGRCIDVRPGDGYGIGLCVIDSEFRRVALGVQGRWVKEKSSRREKSRDKRNQSGFSKGRQASRRCEPPHDDPQFVFWRTRFALQSRNAQTQGQRGMARSAHEESFLQCAAAKFFGSGPGPSIRNVQPSHSVVYSILRIMCVKTAADSASVARQCCASVVMRSRLKGVGAANIPLQARFQPPPIRLNCAAQPHAQARKER